MSMVISALTVAWTPALLLLQEATEKKPNTALIFALGAAFMGAGTAIFAAIVAAKKKEKEKAGKQ